MSFLQSPCKIHVTWHPQMEKGKFLEANSKRNQTSDAPLHPARLSRGLKKLRWSTISYGKKMRFVGRLKQPRCLFSQHIHFTRRWVFWNAPQTMLCTYLLSELKEVLFWNLLTMQLTVQVGNANFHKMITANLRKRPSLKPSCQGTGVWAKLWRHPASLILEAEAEIYFDFRMTHNHRQCMWLCVPNEISKPSKG